jgi:hypothetical protein
MEGPDTEKAEREARPAFVHYPGFRGQVPPCPAAMGQPVLGSTALA